MSSPVVSRPLPVVPFIAADAVLLLTAAFIAWRTPEALAGGALAAVVVCVGLGAVLTVLPFVLNDARERDAALAERQRELVELVNTSTANASRWGTQWASAAIGLEDAASLASRSIAAAERLPAAFQEKADAWAQRLEQVVAHAQEGGNRAATQAVASADLEQVTGAVVRLEQALAGYARIEAGLRERESALAALLAGFPAAAARVQSQQDALEQRLATAPVEIENRLAQTVTAVEARLAATTEVLTERLAGLESALATFAECLQAAPPPPAVAAPEPVKSPEPVVIPVKNEAVPPVAVEAAVAEPVAPKEIMDPFFIPHDGGYSALADAMDSGRT